MKYWNIHAEIRLWWKFRYVWTLRAQVTAFWRFSIYYTVNVIMLSLQLNIPYKCIVNTKSLERCNSCPEYPNNTKFSPQSNFSMNISILGFISAKHEDKRKIKNARIGECMDNLTIICQTDFCLYHQIELTCAIFDTIHQQMTRPCSN